MAGLKARRRKRPQQTITAARSADGRDVIFTVVTPTGTNRMSAPVGSLSLPTPGRSDRQPKVARVGAQ